MDLHSALKCLRTVFTVPVIGKLLRISVTTFEIEYSRLEVPGPRIYCFLLRCKKVV